MKKIFLSLLCLQTFFAFSQLAMTKLDATPINNNDVFEFGALGDPEGYLSLKMYNTSESNIKVKCKVISMTNVTNMPATPFQLCIGPICVNSLTVGNSYPNSGFTIEAQSENGNFDHFFNNVPGDGVNPVEYVFKFYMVNGSNVEVGNSITFTYRYSPNLSVGTFQSLENAGVQLQSNMVRDVLSMTTSKNIQMDMFDLNGRLLISRKMTAGDHNIPVSDLPTGVYLANFVNEEGMRATAKVIKK